MSKIFYLSFFLFALSILSCTKENINNDRTTEEYCTLDSECNLPIEYAVQSNCPFVSVCIDNSCKVVCPLWYHASDPVINGSYNYACGNDSDCDCSERGDRTIRCLCMERGCVSVESE